MLWVYVIFRRYGGFIYLFCFFSALCCIVGVAFWVVFQRHGGSCSLPLGSLEKMRGLLITTLASLNLCLCGHKTRVTVSQWNPALCSGLYLWKCLTISFACSLAFLSHFMSSCQHYSKCQIFLCTNALARVSQRLNRLWTVKILLVVSLKLSH